MISLTNIDSLISHLQHGKPAMDQAIVKFFANSNFTKTIANCDFEVIGSKLYFRKMLDTNPIVTRLAFWVDEMSVSQHLKSEHDEKLILFIKLTPETVTDLAIDYIASLLV